MSFQDTLDAFFLPEDQDAFARSQGWQDSEQMCYYEDQQQEIPPMTDREAEDMIEREQGATIVDGTVEYLAPPPSEILVLMRPDPREGYDDLKDWQDDECCCIDCQPDIHDLTGVY